MCFQAAILRTLDFHVLMGKIVIGVGQQIVCDRRVRGESWLSEGWLAISGYDPRKPLSAQI